MATTTKSNALAAEKIHEGDTILHWKLTSKQVQTFATGATIGAILLALSDGSLGTAGPVASAVGSLMIGVMVSRVLSNVGAAIATAKSQPANAESHAGSTMVWSEIANVLATLPLEIGAIGLVVSFFLPNVTTAVGLIVLGMAGNLGSLLQHQRSFANTTAHTTADTKDGATTNVNTTSNVHPTTESIINPKITVTASEPPTPTSTDSEISPFANLVSPQATKLAKIILENTMSPRKTPTIVPIPFSRTPSPPPMSLIPVPLARSSTPPPAYQLQWNLTNHPTKGFSVTVGPGNFKRIAVSILSDCLTILGIAECKRRVNHLKHTFTSSHELPYYGKFDVSNLRQQLLVRAKEIYPPSSAEHGHIVKLVERVMDADHVSTLAVVIAEVVDMVKNVEQQIVGREVNGYFRFVAGDSGVSLYWAKTLGDDYMSAVSQMVQEVRNEGRKCTVDEFLALQVAYHKLSQGCICASSHIARCLGTPGFRIHAQTYMSLTDPGDGHVMGTTHKTEWMKGAIVHVEHLERPGHLPRSECESYRIPSLVDFAKVRLQVGSAAPTTYFVGRMLKDGGNFEHDYIKVVNTTGAAASAAFSMGSAECKVAMDGLTTSQMVKYMRGLAGNTLRASGRQFLSCAWNLNTTIVDDLAPYSPESPRLLTEQMDIGRRAIEVASLGGFDKVTWDGASDKYPSKCIVEQLGFENALELVHLAHQAGFVTYMSAGFKFHQIRDAALAGVDGIGIGGAQVLRYMDHTTGMHGPYLEENIDEILLQRDFAEQSTRGRGVHLLCRLDRMHFEGSITASDDRTRQALYNALRSQDEPLISQIISECNRIVDLPDDGEKPYTGYARRLLLWSDPLLKRVAGEEEWNDFVSRISQMLTWDDEAEIYEEYISEPWAGWRAKHKAGEPKVGGRPVDSDLKSVH
ncbi:hypothetical protein HDV00_007438 [Rhizophlyctis rosea]|nr:hypothetical protein HDV00_007438 [Rhizophlyctis rosea]